MSTGPGIHGPKLEPGQEFEKFGKSSSLDQDEQISKLTDRHGPD